MGQARTGTLPRIELRPEERAPADIRAIYEEIKDRLGIPWLPAIFQAYAMYPPLLRLAWAELKPSVVTLDFRGDAREIRALAERSMAAIYRPAYDRAQLERWQGDVHAILTLCETFNYGNPKLLICARAVSRGMEGRRTSVERDEPDLRPDRPPPEEDKIRHRRIEMVDAVNPPAAVARIFDDIKQTLGLPLVNSDYRGLARWPEYFHHAWEDLRPTIQSEAYGRARQQVANAGDAAAEQLEEPVTLTPDILRRDGVPAGEMDNLVRLVRLFADLLPGLILNVEGFRLPLLA